MITAHSQGELLELLDRFPRVNAVIIHSDTPGERHGEILAQVKNGSKLPVILLSPGANQRSHLADHVLNSHEPQELLQLLQKLFGDARLIDGGSNRRGAE